MPPRHLEAVIPPPEEIVVSTKRVACDGGGGALGHPMVYLTLSDSGRADCPYCGRRFELKPGAKAGHGH